MLVSKANYYKKRSTSIALFENNCSNLIHQESLIPLHLSEIEWATHLLNES